MFEDILGENIKNLGEKEKVEVVIDDKHDHGDVCGYCEAYKGVTYNSGMCVLYAGVDFFQVACMKYKEIN